MMNPLARRLGRDHAEDLLRRVAIELDRRRDLVGAEQVDGPLELDRDDAEEIFRIVATEPARRRAHNPGLPSEHVDTIIATCCIVLAFMRRLHLDRATLAICG